MTEVFFTEFNRVKEELYELLGQTDGLNYSGDRASLSFRINDILVHLLECDRPDPRGDMLRIVLERQGAIPRGIMYSSDIILLGNGLTVFNHEVPYAYAFGYFDLFKKYWPLIDKGLLRILPAYWEDDEDFSEDHFNPDDFDAVSLLDPSDKSTLARQLFFQDSPAATNLHCKVVLPDVSNLRVDDLAGLVQEEEIFHEYENALLSLYLRTSSQDSEERLAGAILEVDERVRELNSRFLEMRGHRRWEATRGMFGLSTATISLLLAPELSQALSALVGTVGLIQAADSVAGIVQEKKSFRRSPYFFAWEASRKSGKG